MTSDVTCLECAVEMQQVGETRRTFEPDPETMTDGQLAEQYAAEMGGPFEEGVHGMTRRVYECPECGRQVERQ